MAVLTRAQHRASIRSSIINAAIDYGVWTEFDDQLLDIVDQWLDRKNVDTPADQAATDKVRAQFEEAFAPASKARADV